MSVRKRGNSNHGIGAWATFRAEMDAFDRLPAEFKDFVRHANHQWACVPMLKRALKCGRSAYGTRRRLLKAYLEEDAAPPTITCR
jgi:hypothetical protein